MIIMRFTCFTIAFFILGCSTQANNPNTAMSSSDVMSSSELHESSSSSSDLLRIWNWEGCFGRYYVKFTNLDFDTATLSVFANVAPFIDGQVIEGSLYPSKPWVDEIGYGEFSFPDSTFLRGDTIRYRIEYTLNGKLDSTEWQTYVFLGNHITYRTTTKDDTIQQFDSIAYPIVLGPNDSCGQAIVAFIYTYSTADTFDYEANWSAMFSDGRTYVKNYNLACPKEAPPLFGKLGIMTYEGDINEAAKAIQKINPVFFLNLKPFCEEYTQCIIPNPL